MINKITCTDDFVKLEAWPGLFFLLAPLVFSYFYISDYLQGNVDADNFLFVIDVFIVPVTLISLAIASIKTTAIFYKEAVGKSANVLGFKGYQ